MSTPPSTTGGTTPQPAVPSPASPPTAPPPKPKGRNLSGPQRLAKHRLDKLSQRFLPKGAQLRHLFIATDKPGASGRPQPSAAVFGPLTGLAFGVGAMTGAVYLLFAVTDEATYVLGSRSDRTPTVRGDVLPRDTVLSEAMTLGKKKKETTFYLSPFFGGDIQRALAAVNGEEGLSVEDGSSPYGRFWWDGKEWVAVTLSADGHYWWDGTEWRLSR